MNTGRQTDRHARTYRERDNPPVNTFYNEHTPVNSQLTCLPITATLNTGAQFTNIPPLGSTCPWKTEED